MLPVAFTRISFISFSCQKNYAISIWLEAELFVFYLQVAIALLIKFQNELYRSCKVLLAIWHIPHAMSEKLNKIFSLLFILSLWWTVSTLANSMKSALKLFQLHKILIITSVANLYVNKLSLQNMQNRSLILLLTIQNRPATRSKTYHLTLILSNS